MKYLLICIIALIVCFGIGLCVTTLIDKLCRKKWKVSRRLGMSAIIEIVLVLIAIVVYLSIYYHADEVAEKALQGNEYVQVKEINGGYFFDGPQSEKAIIFYPGAKVEAKSYSPLMLELANAGYDCFLVKMPYNIALISPNAADQMIENYDYKEWTIMGHSLGGVAAANYTTSHANKVSQLVLLASYPTKQLPERIRLISIYGNQDGCLNMNDYEDGKKYWPSNSLEHVINGGNHAQMGSYGEQKGDRKASIDAKEQWEEIVKLMMQN